MNQPAFRTATGLKDIQILVYWGLHWLLMMSQVNEGPI